MHNPITQQQAEQLLEDTTPAPWEASVQAFAENEGGGYSLHAEVSDKDGVPLMYAEDAFVFHKEPNFTLAAASPDLARTVIWLWEQNQQQQAKIKRLQAGVLETSRGEWAYTTPEDMEDELESLIEGDMK